MAINQPMLKGELFIRSSTLASGLRYPPGAGKLPGRSADFQPEYSWRAATIPDRASGPGTGRLLSRL
jgi:hypothetical protein